MAVRISLPSSKSITHRALFCAALAELSTGHSGESELSDPLWCDDTLITKKVLGALKSGANDFFCAESGTTYRFLTAVLAALGVEAEVTGAPSLLHRPIAPLKEGLKNLGSKTPIFLDGRISSQFLSALLLAAPLAKTPTTIQVQTPIVSKPYVDLTIDMMKKFGVVVEKRHDCHCEERSDETIQFVISPKKYLPAKIQIEKDWSAAAFWIAAGLIHREVVLEGLNPESLQGDRQILELVKEMGGEFEWRGEGSGAELWVRPSNLRGVRWNFSDTPDLYPAACVLEKFARGRCEFSGVKRLREKESDRLEEVQKMLAIYSKQAGPIMIDSADHRIIMAAAILGLTQKEKMGFQHPEAVAKSYPDFWKTYASL